MSKKSITLSFPTEEIKTMYEEIAVTSGNDSLPSMTRKALLHFVNRYCDKEIALKLKELMLVAHNNKKQKIRGVKNGD
jgi:hypothetical protein